MHSLAYLLHGSWCNTVKSGVARVKISIKCVAHNRMFYAVRTASSTLQWKEARGWRKIWVSNYFFFFFIYLKSLATFICRLSSCGFYPLPSPNFIAFSARRSRNNSGRRKMIEVAHIWIPRLFSFLSTFIHLIPHSVIITCIHKHSRRKRMLNDSADELPRLSISTQ